MAHVPNRQSLSSAEKAAIDEIMISYHARRESARTALQEAQTTYLANVSDAANDRDTELLNIVDAAPGRGTQTRIAEYLGMNASHLSKRLRGLRRLAARRTTEAPPGIPGGASTSTTPTTDRI